MGEVHVFEGKTSTEAIEKGLKELNISKSKVDIKILEAEEKRSFFSILTPRVVKVEMRIKEEIKIEKRKTTIVTENIDTEEFIKNIEKFLEEFLNTLPTQGLTYKVEDKDGIIYVDIDGEDTGYLIGYRGEVLNSIQTVISNVASRTSKEKARVVVNIGAYRQKREKDLQILATKIAGTVVKTRKSITLEPMPAYERKVIHTKLQENDKVKTYSVGEEPYRKVVVALK